MSGVAAWAYGRARTVLYSKKFLCVLVFEFPEQVGVLQFFFGVFVLVELPGVLVVIVVGEALDTQAAFINGDSAQNVLGKFPVK